MDTAAIQTIVSHMKGRSFYSILKAMVSNHFVELKSARWWLEVDGEELGRVVINHDLVVDDVLGIAFESWAWIVKGQTHVLHLSGDREGSFELAFDGAEIKEPSLEFDTYVNEENDQTHLLMHVRFEERYFKFNALLE